MNLSRFFLLAVALAGTSAMIACTTAPATPMGAAPANGMATSGRMAAMDAQTQAMREMQTKMTNAKTPEERQALMAEHMKAMQGGMGMMQGMSGMGAAGDPSGMTGNMAERQKMMAQHTAMMQVMMDMMMQRMASMQGKP
jgi:hypothetical protein